ncbi:MAG: cation-translocating P-type ATPase [Anaerolineaceae bacterium]
MVSKKETPPAPAGEDISVSWHCLDSNEVLEKLVSSLHSGLSTQEAEERLGKYGYNQLTEAPRPTFLMMVLEQLKSFVVLLLIGASIISAILGEWVDATAIIAIVVLNTVMGVIQESRAEEALAALKKMAAPEAQVMRDGRRQTVPSHKLVPGDIVFLEAGNFIPADLRLLEAFNLKVDEAALTGESVAVQKNCVDVLSADASIGDRKNSAFMGTTVTYGRGKGVITSTGMHTQLGLIATMLQSVEDEDTPLQKKLEQLGKTLGWACLIICALVFAVGWMRGGEPLEMFMVAVSLAIAAVPEGLPAIVTISLALGMREMVRRHALIRHLASVETLGSATVICSDKTGTLTQNEMTVTRVWVDGKFIEISGTGYAPVGDFHVDNHKINPADYPGMLTALWIGALNNDAELEYDDQGNFVRMVGDPTEGSILVAAAKAGGIPVFLNDAYPREGEIPFDSTRKRMVTVHKVLKPCTGDISLFKDDSPCDCYVVAAKGAPDVGLSLCTYYHPMDDSAPVPLTPEKRLEILAANDSMTKDALRVLGLAYRIADCKPEEYSEECLEKELVFAGLVGMIDPARPEVAPALREASAAGIRTIMITGDYPNTACAIAERITLLEPGGAALTGKQLDELDDQAMQEATSKYSVFARVSPEHKMRIVKALQANHQIVAMTGDGVNDAPAIKMANIGVAMGITGTDVAKETADMVLTDDNYASIVSAVEQGRIIYSNIRKFVYYLISCNMAEILVIFIPTILGKGSPLQAIQLLWLNLVTDGAPALALGTEKGDPDIMNQKPRPHDEPIINKNMQIGVAIQAVFITAATLGAYFIGLAHNEVFAQTMAFITLSVSELLRAYTARSEYYPILKIGLFGNKFMNYAVGASLVLILLVLYVPFLNTVFKTVPLGLSEWIRITPLILVPSVAAELTKLVLKRGMENEPGLNQEINH